MLEGLKNRVFVGKALNILVYITVVTFFVGVILAYHYMLYSEKRDRIIFDGQVAAIQTVDHLDQYFSQNGDAVRLTAYTLEDMLAQRRTKSEILNYLGEQTAAVSKTVIKNTKGIYSYIQGEYLDGTGWIPYADFHATERPWYIKAMENKDRITIVDPYVDAQTGKVMMTIAKELGDGESVVAMDIRLDRVQQITEEAVASGNSDYEIIIDTRNVIVAHSNPSEIGKSYGEETGTFGALLLEKAGNTASDWFEMDYAGENYIVYVAEGRNGWRCLSVNNATKVFQPLQLLLWITIAVVAIAVLVLSYIMAKFYQQYLAANQVSKRLQSIANIYVSMFEVDNVKDRMNIIQGIRTFRFKKTNFEEKSANAIMVSIAHEIADKASLEDLIRFVTVDTLAERLKNVETISMEFFTVTRKWIRVRFIVSQRDAYGSPTRLLLLAEDINREKNERDALLNVSERAVAASEAKSLFLSAMSHEIRTPINAVLGMSEMILRESREGGILSYAENIKNAGTMLLGLVNNVLDFSEIEAGKIELAPVEYDLSAILNELADMIQGQADAKGLAVSLDFDKATPKRLFGDDVRIRQIIANLLINAVKYTEKGSVTFSVGFRRMEDEPDSIMLHVAVKDSGIGIKPEDMNRLFQKFERIEESRNRGIEGMGLGLAIAQNLLYMMGTALQVESIYGLGSKFHFHLRQKVVKWEPLGE